MIENKDRTVKARLIIDFASPDEWVDELELFDGTEYAMELDRRNPVLEGILDRLEQIGCKTDVTDSVALSEELKRRYNEKGIEGGLPKAVKNWISGKSRVNPAYRENLYNLCIALDMNLEETREFFLKNYMTIPFNYKDRVDAIYFYGLSHGLEYHQIHGLLSEFDDIEEINASQADETQVIGNYISEISDLDVFREYLSVHTYGKKQQYNSAAVLVNNLLEEDDRYARIEKTIKSEPPRKNTQKKGGENYDEANGSKTRGINIKALLDVIYGYDNQELYRRTKGTKISKCEYLPKLFRENFPNDQEFSRISNREASPDVYRKTIIILNFYNYFCSSLVMFMYETDAPEDNSIPKHLVTEYQERDVEIIEADLEDFYIETSGLLAGCGFEQMYARNPFDWLILYCAKSTNPLDTFRELLQVRFIEKDEA